MAKHRESKGGLGVVLP